MRHSNMFIALALALVLVACGGGENEGRRSAETSAASAPLDGASTGSSEVPRPMLGLYRYLADAGSFVDCTTGERFFVSPEADNIALEKGYLGARRDAGEPVLVELVGHLDNRPRMDGEGTQRVLIVDTFQRALPDSTCAPPVFLENIYWRLIELHGVTVPVLRRQQEAHLRMVPRDKSAQGFGGCNRFFAGCEVDGQNIHFSQVAATRMACPEGMDQEDQFLRVLSEVRSFDVARDTLVFYGEKEAIARFRAVYGR